MSNPRPLVKPKFKITPCVDLLAAKLELDMSHLQEAILIARDSDAKDFELSFRDKLFQVYRDQVIGIAGESLWSRVVRVLADHRYATPLIRKHALKQFGTNSLATESMKRSGVEVIKNAMDALITRFIEKPHLCPQHLSIRFEVTLEEDKVSLLITDNAGGFPLTVIADYTSYALDAEALLKRHCERTEKLTARDIPYFGGNGRGFIELIAFAAHGSHVIVKSQKPALLQVFTLPDSDCLSVSLSNVNISPDWQGACIKLTSPLVPLRRCSQELVWQFFAQGAAQQALEHTPTPPHTDSADETRTVILLNTQIRDDITEPEDFSKVTLVKTPIWKKKKTKASPQDQSEEEKEACTL